MYLSTRFCLLLLLTTVGLSSGCTTFGDWGKAKEYVEWPLSRFAKDYQQPQRIAVIWSPDVMTVPGQPAMRGFGGRLYFYNEKSVAVPVKGELMIYGYEEPAPNVSMNSSQAPSKKTVPDKKFKFSPEQFAERFSKSDLGASYSIWIPWDEAGGSVKRISLIPIFKMENEQVVYGDPAELTLPGRTPETAMKQTSFHPVMTAAHQGANPSMAASSAAMQPQPQQPAAGYPQTVYPAGYPSNGVSPQAAPYLPLNGVTAANYNTQISYPGAVSPAGFQNGLGTSSSQFGNVPASGLKTTTIQLPPKVGNRLGSPNSESSSPQTNAAGLPTVNTYTPNAYTPTAQTMMQMQAAGMDPQMQSRLLGHAPPQSQSVISQQQPTQQMPNGSPPYPSFSQESLTPSTATIQNPQLQQLPTDFGPRKRQARAR